MCEQMFSNKNKTTVFESMCLCVCERETLIEKHIRLLPIYLCIEDSILFIFSKQTWCTLCVLVAQSCPTLCDPMTVACQAPLSVGFSRQEQWSGLLFPFPGDLPDPGS